MNSNKVINTHAREMDLVQTIRAAPSLDVAFKQLKTFIENRDRVRQSYLEEQQKPVIKITDHYFTDGEIIDALEFMYDRGSVRIKKDDTGFYYREETEI